MRIIIILFILDWLYLNLGFWLVNYLAVNQFNESAPSSNLILFLNIVWLTVTLGARKFDIKSVHTFSGLVFRLTRGILLMLFLLSFVFILWDLRAFQRIHILGTFFLLWVLEMITITAFFPRLEEHFESAAGSKSRRSFELYLILADLALFIFLFFVVHYFKYGTVVPETTHWMVLGMMSGFWLFSAEWTTKFEKLKHPDFYFAYEPFIKAAFIMISGAALLLLLFKIFNFSRVILFGPVVLLLLVEIPMVLAWVRIRSAKPEDDIESLESVRKVLNEQGAEQALNVDVVQPARERLEKKYLFNFPRLFRLLQSNCDLDKISLQRLTVIDSATEYNFKVLDDHSVQMFINLHRVNDFRRINYYFLQVHGKLAANGYFIGVKDTLESHSEYLHAKFPKYMARTISIIDFMVHRVMPKMPVLDKVYFAISRGRNRVLSRAELLGRLYYCGFKVLRVEELGSKLYFIAQKDKAPSLHQTPSYGPLVQLKRVGLNGRIFDLYKLRTMHPYSEFIQDYIYQNNRLDTSGKFQDDFRITSWGRVMRKFWIDELPQLINYVRGDIKIFGARALSEQYYSLYPRDVQELRIKFKPGLIPPFYADMPKSFDEIVESERRYFHRKLAHPWRTDCIYFMRAVYNILIKRARSN